MSKLGFQVGAIPFRTLSDGLKVLLITSRDTGRWVIPKGGVEGGDTPRKAAAREAFEGAGVRGVIGKKALGLFSYEKRLRSGRAKPTTVEVFTLHVKRELKNWPERGQRRLVWMTIAEAVGLVEEPSLVDLLLRLEEIHRTNDLTKWFK